MDNDLTVVLLGSESNSYNWMNKCSAYFSSKLPRSWEEREVTKHRHASRNCKHWSKSRCERGVRGWSALKELGGEMIAELIKSWVEMTRKGWVGTGWHDVLVGNSKERAFCDYTGPLYVGVSGCSAASFTLQAMNRLKLVGCRLKFSGYCTNSKTLSLLVIWFGWCVDSLPPDVAFLYVSTVHQLVCLTPCSSLPSSHV